MFIQALKKSCATLLKYAFIAVLTTCMMVGLLIGYVWLWDMPEDESIRNPEIKQASTLLDTKGRFIGLYQSEFRNIIQYEEINPDIKKCLLAVEDARFYEHNGIDFRALGRVLLKSILMGDKSSGGGSTITQQLAKQLFPRSDIKDKNWFGKNFQLLKSKIKEWILAVKIENIYSKNEIMTMYLNKFEFINGAYGIDAAAYTYFGRPQSEISLAEAAILVGMLKNPSLYNPARFPELVITRRNEVISKVEEQYKLNLSNVKKSEADFSKFRRNVIYDTIAPYFKASLEKYLNTLIRTRNIKKPNGTYYDIYADGLTIESTIDLDLQQFAEEATMEHMIWIQKWFDYDWAQKDPWTYDADEITRNIRLSSLNRKAKASLRYEALRKKHLNPFLARWNFKASEDDIAAILASDTMPAIFKDLSIEKNRLYRSIKEDSIYPSLVSAYQRLQDDFLSEFNTKTKVKIFDNKTGLKTAFMTPMDSVRYHSKLLQTGLVAIDPRNGHVKCWNGGLNYNYFKYDHVTTRRSVGSTLKPFLYAVAMTEKGIKPCSEFKDTSYAILPGEGDFENCVPWYPENATKVYTQFMYNLYHGLLYSKNSITVKLLKEIGSVEPLRNLLDRVGISKTDTLPNGRLAVPPLPSIALGAVDITLLQLTSAYTTFANNGIYRKPILVKTIKDSDGNVIFTSKEETTMAIDPLHNAIMLDMLINNEKGEFTMNLKSENGGKTGTTDDQCDGWFVGLTPTLVVGSWTGGDDKWIRFLRDDVGQGYFTARPVFEKFIRKLEASQRNIYDSSAKFIDPPIGFREMTNCKKVKKEQRIELLRTQEPSDFDFYNF